MEGQIVGIKIRNKSRALLRIAALEYIVKYMNRLRSKSLGETNREIKSNIMACFRYFVKAGNLSYVIAKATRYQDSVTLSLLFMPMFIRSGNIPLTSVNARPMIKWIAKNVIPPRILHKVQVVDAEEYCVTFLRDDYFLMEKLLSKLPNVTKIVLGTSSDDQIFDIICKTCRKLVYLDTRANNLCQVTDIGINMLSNLKDLKHVFIGSTSDEFDDADERVVFTANSVANVFRSLPEIVEFECPEYILRKAFCMLVTSKDSLPEFKCLQQSTKSTLAAAALVCRNIDLVCTTSYGEEDLRDINAGLKTFDTLNNLSLSLSSERIELMSWSEIGPKLTVLEIMKEYFTALDITLLNRNCQNLTKLEVRETTKYEVPRIDNIVISEPSVDSVLFFPALLTLTFHLRYLENIRLFFHPNSSLTKLSIRTRDDEEYSVAAKVRYLKKAICFPALEELSIPEFLCPVDVAEIFIDKFPQLRELHMNFEKESNIYQLICLKFNLLRVKE